VLEPALRLATPAEAWAGPVLGSDPSDALPTPGGRARPRSCQLRHEGEGDGEGEPGVLNRAGGEYRAERYLRHAVPLGAAILVLVSLIPGIGSRLPRRWQLTLLALLAALAIGNYVDFGQWRDDRYVNDWEFFHYYLGSKYAPEIGYTGLYAAALSADDETGRKLSQDNGMIRDLETAGCISVDDVLEWSEPIVSRFSPERWAEFTGDIRHFKSRLSQSRWDGLFHDKGYNATPVWTMVARPLTNGVTTSSPIGLLWLSLLDLLWTLGAVVAVWRTFGPRAALLMVVLIGTHMTMSHSHMKGALLRTDWVMSLVLAVCAVKSDRPVAGGALAAFAAMLRVFPAALALGLIGRPVVAWLRGEPPRRAQVRFAVAFVVVAVLLFALSLLVLGSGYWGEFTEKIWQHHDSFSPWRVGFKHLFLGAYEYRAEGTATHQEVFRDRWVLWWAIQALVLVGLGYLSRRLRDWEILALGFVPLFFLVAPTYYYYILLVIPLLFFAGRMGRLECAIGVAWLVGSSSIAYVVHGAVGRELPLSYTLSLLILGTCLLMTLSAWLEPVGRRNRAEPAA